ncbi:Mitochondrial chaperone BCS1 [Saccharomyces cerevisiae S288c] [Rhizoctonia solani]|uniref:Mitochondrial chaperone BCS1 [Saccharomyces cerevisiae S288c] n=1 Tax=Rhizoctonia solani TaxID=456999 RepID=A0A0K6G3N1_9AGAM|nr:Mitochondrial chaperone BCS1 [Saccharomyces cerevisiae S288c] [Rhizoctonia solani]
MSVSDIANSPPTLPSQDGVTNIDTSAQSETGSISKLISQFTDGNPYFSAGFGLMGVGVGLTVLRRGATILSTLAQRRLLVSLEIPIRDHSHAWFLEWMAHQAKNRTLQASGIRIHSHQLAVETTKTTHSNGASDVVFSLVPAPGTHWFRYQGAWIQVKRERQEKLLDLNSGSPWETVTLTTLARDRALFSSLLAEARDLALQGNEGRTVIYIARGIEWTQFGRPRRKRELGSVVLAEGVADKILQDVQSFMNRGKWYTERGIPYRRGYLLHGPPGSGKSSFIQALAGSLRYNICVLNISERGLTDDKLNYLLAHVPERSFVLLEDIDAAFNKRVQTSDDGYQSGVTFSGLLNALDGVASGEERIVFMTTNHLSRLDPALVRPGRVDLIQLLDDAQPDQAAQLFARFYGRGQSEVVPGKLQDSDNLEIQHLAEKVKQITTSEINDGKRASMAALQGHFILHNAEDAIKSLASCFKARSS